MRYEDLTEEQKYKALACKTPEEVLALAKEQGYELSEEEINQVSGGWGGSDTCTDGNKHNFVIDRYPPFGQPGQIYRCTKCGYEVLG